MNNTLSFLQTALTELDKKIEEATQAQAAAEAIAANLATLNAEKVKLLQAIQLFEGGEDE